MLLITVINKNGIDINIQFCQVFLKLCLPCNILFRLSTFPATRNWSRQARMVLVVLFLTVFRRRYQIKNELLDAFIALVVFQAEQQLKCTCDRQKAIESRQQLMEQKCINFAKIHVNNALSSVCYREQVERIKDKQCTAANSHTYLPFSISMANHHRQHSKKT